MQKMKTDCFGYDKLSGKCKIMVEDVCKKRNCTFYKTCEQYRRDAEKYAKGCGKHDEVAR